MYSFTETSDFLNIYVYSKYLIKFNIFVFTNFHILLIFYFIDIIVNFPFHILDTQT